MSSFVPRALDNPRTVYNFGKLLWPCLIAEVALGANVQMTYLNRRTLTTRHIEAELSSARAVTNPSYIPPHRIGGPITVLDSEYDFKSEDLLQSVLNMTGTSISGDDVDGPGTAMTDPHDLATNLKQSGLGTRSVQSNACTKSG